MAKFRIMFSRLVRATELYEEDDNMDWEPDSDWGAEDGTHYIIVDGKLIPFSDVG